MTSLNFLYYALGVGFLAFVTIIGVLVYHVIKTLTSLRILVENTDTIIQDVRSVKDIIKIGIIGKAAKLFKVIF